MTALYSHSPMLPVGAMANSSLYFARNVAGCWFFDEGAGDAILDSGFYGNHGVLVGGVNRAAGPALQFDGVAAYASIPHAPSLMPSRMTLFIRMRNLAGPAQFDTVLIKCANSSWHDGFGLFFDSPATLLKFWVGDFTSGGIAQITVDPLADNTVVATYDGSQVRICANGIAGSPVTYSAGITPNTGPLEFGRGRDNAYNINALIYQVIILNYALPLEDALRASSV